MAVARYVSPPIAIPKRGTAYRRADLHFYGVDHSGSSFEARVFLNHPDADAATPREAGAGYAGSFYIFGHGGCFGDAGHCDVPPGPRRPYDRRLPHQLTPQHKLVVITEALRRLEQGGATAMTVTVVPAPSDSPVSADERLLRFQQLSLLLYA